MVRIGNIELGEYPLLFAPMEDISDPPFRQIYHEYFADKIFSEFSYSKSAINES